MPGLSWCFQGGGLHCTWIYLGLLILSPPEPPEAVKPNPETTRMSSYFWKSNFEALKFIGDWMKPFFNLFRFSNLGKNSEILHRFIDFGIGKAMDDQLKHKSKPQGPDHVVVWCSEGPSAFLCHSLTPTLHPQSLYEVQSTHSPPYSSRRDVLLILLAFPSTAPKARTDHCNIHSWNIPTTWCNRKQLLESLFLSC